MDSWKIKQIVVWTLKSIQLIKLFELWDLIIIIYSYFI